MIHPTNGERVIITADLLMEQFGEWLPDQPECFFFVMAPFFLPSDEKAENYFRRRLTEFEAKPIGPDQAGMQLAIDILHDLERGYSKMTVFERDRIRKDLPAKARARMTHVSQETMLKFLEGFSGLMEWR